MNEKLNQYSSMINAALDEYVPESGDELNKALIDSMRYSLMNGGKRIRPVLALAFCELCGGKPDAVLPFACAVEMIHTYSLIHDDLPCMDDDDMRRGKPCNHLVFGEDTAMLAGDALLTLAFETALDTANKAVPAEQVVTGTKILAQLSGKDGMVGGQCIDLRTEGKNVDIGVLKRMDFEKTVGLISAACQMGCIAAGSGEKAVRAAAVYAENIGMAFQIRDDILDVVGDKDLLGKPTGSDEKNKKSNYVSLLGIDKAQECVKDYTEKAVAALAQFDGDISFLQDLAHRMAKREN